MAREDYFVSAPEDLVPVPEDETAIVELTVNGIPVTVRDGKIESTDKELVAIVDEVRGYYVEGDISMFVASALEEIADAEVVDVYLPSDKNRLAKADLSKVQGKGVMVAWFLPTDLAEETAVAGGEPLEELHCTLLYFGKELTDDQIDIVKAAVKALASKWAPMKGFLDGAGAFAPTESSDGKKPLIRLLSAPRWEGLREDLYRTLKAKGVEAYTNHGYVPHVTLKYLDADETVQLENLERPAITIEELTLAVGGEHTKYKLTGEEVYKGNPCHNKSDGKFCSTGSKASARKDLDEDQREWAEAWDKKAEQWKLTKLRDSLLSHGGIAACIGDWSANKPDQDAKMIQSKGSLQSSKHPDLKVALLDNQCHWNAAGLLRAGKVDSIGTGFVLTNDHSPRWIPHSWGVKDGKIVETTQANFNAKAYYGVTLSGVNAKQFAFKMEVDWPEAVAAAKTKAARVTVKKSDRVLPKLFDEADPNASYPKPDWQESDDLALEFGIEKYNPCHNQSDGKFCSTGRMGSGFSPEEERALRNYKENDYREVNRFTRLQPTEREWKRYVKDHPGTSSYEKIQETTKLLDSAFENAPQLRRDTVVYRGAVLNNNVNYQIDVDKVFAPGNILPAGCYQSTSRSKKVAGQFAAESMSVGTSVIFEIKVPKGTRAIAMDQFKPSHISNEQEMLLHRTTRYKTISIKDDVHVNRGGGKKNVKLIQMEVVQ